MLTRRPGQKQTTSVNMKQATCRNKNPTAISGEHSIKRFYPSMNALHCLKNVQLYAVILHSASQVNKRRDFAVRTSWLKAI